MSSFPASPLRLTVGIFGFGAFGRLIAQCLAPHLTVCVYDPNPPRPAVPTYGARLTGIVEAARCPVVILAAPVNVVPEAVTVIAPHLQPGTLVVDVGSVKLLPVEAMRAGLPADVEILGTHPLFGPQSAADGPTGLKIAVCPLRGRQGRCAAAFLRRVRNFASSSRRRRPTNARPRPCRD